MVVSRRVEDAAEILKPQELLAQARNYSQDEIFDLIEKLSPAPIGDDTQQEESKVSEVIPPSVPAGTVSDSVTPSQPVMPSEPVTPSQPVTPRASVGIETRGVDELEKIDTSLFIPAARFSQDGEAPFVTSEFREQEREKIESPTGWWGAGARALELVSVPFSFGTSIPASMYYLYKDIAKDGVDVSDFGNLAKNIFWRPKGLIDIWLESSTAEEMHPGVSFAIGLGLEIFADPLTYISFGTSGLLKATGKGGKYIDDMASAGSRFVRKVGEDSFEYTLSPKGTRLAYEYMKDGLDQTQAGKLIAQNIASGGKEAEELIHNGGWYFRGMRGATEPVTALFQIAGMASGGGINIVNNRILKKVPVVGDSVLTDTVGWVGDKFVKGGHAVRNLEKNIETGAFGWGQTYKVAPLQMMDSAFDGSLGQIPVIGGAYDVSRKVRRVIGKGLEGTRVKAGDWVQKQNFKLIQGEMAKHLSDDGKLAIKDREKYLADMDWIKEVIGNEDVGNGGFISKKLSMPLSNIALLRTSGSLKLDELIQDVSEIEFELAGDVGNFNREFIQDLKIVAELEGIGEDNTAAYNELMTNVIHTARMDIPQHTAGLEMRKAVIDRDLSNLQEQVLDTKANLDQAAARATSIADLQTKTSIMSKQVTNTLKNADLASSLSHDVKAMRLEAEAARDELLSSYTSVIERGQRFIEDTGYLDESNKMRYPVLDYINSLNKRDTAEETLADFLRLFEDEEDLSKLISANAAPGVSNVKELTAKYMAYLSELEEKDILNYKMSSFADRVPRILTQEGKRSFSRALKKAGLTTESGNVFSTIQRTLAHHTIKNLNRALASSAPNDSLVNIAWEGQTHLISEVTRSVNREADQIVGGFIDNQKLIEESMSRLTRKVTDPDVEISPLDREVWEKFNKDVVGGLLRGEFDEDWGQALRVLKHIDDDFNWAVPSLASGGKLFTDDLKFLTEMHGKQMTRYHTGKSLLYEAARVFGKTAGEIENKMAPDELKAWYREQETYNPALGSRAIGTIGRGAVGATSALIVSEAGDAWEGDKDDTPDWKKLAAGLGVGMFLSPKVRKNVRNKFTYKANKFNFIIPGLHIVGAAFGSNETPKQWLREGYEWKKDAAEAPYRVELEDGEVKIYEPERIPLALKAFQDNEAGPAYRAQRWNELRKNYIGDGDQTPKTYIPIGRSREVNVSSNHSKLSYDGPLLPYNMKIRSAPDTDGNYTIRTLEDVWYRDILGLDDEFKGNTDSARRANRHIKIGQTTGTKGERIEDHVKKLIQRSTFNDIQGAQEALNAETLGFNPEELFQSQVIVDDIVKKTQRMLKDVPPEQVDDTLQLYQEMTETLLEENPYFAIFLEEITRPLMEYRAEQSNLFKKTNSLYTKYDPLTSKPFTKSKILNDADSKKAFFEQVLTEVNPLGEGFIPINSDASRTKLWHWIFDRLEELGDEDSLFPPDSFNSMWHFSKENPAWVMSLWRVFSDNQASGIAKSDQISSLMLESGYGKHSHINRYLAKRWEHLRTSDPERYGEDYSFLDYSSALVEQYRDAYREWGKQNPQILEEIRAMGYSGLREELDRPSTAFSLLLTMDEPNGSSFLRLDDLTETERTLARWIDVAQSNNDPLVTAQEMVGVIPGLKLTVKQAQKHLDDMVTNGHLTKHTVLTLANPLGQWGYSLKVPLEKRGQGSVLNRWTTIPVIERTPREIDGELDISGTVGSLGYTPSDFRVMVHPDYTPGRKAESTLNSDPYGDDTLLSVQAEYNMQEYGGKEISIAPNEMLADLLWETRPKVEDAPNIFQELKQKLDNGDSVEEYEYLVDRLVMSGNRFRNQSWDPELQGKDIVTIDEYIGRDDLSRGSYHLTELMQQRMNAILGPNFWGQDPPRHLRERGAASKQVAEMAEGDLERLIEQIQFKDPNIDPEKFLRILNEDTLDLTPDSADIHRIKKLARYGYHVGYKRHVNNTFMEYLRKDGIKDTKKDPYRSMMVARAYINLQNIAMQPIKDNQYLSLSFNDTISFARELLQQWDKLPKNKVAPAEDLGFDLDEIITAYFPEDRIDNWREEQRKKILRPLLDYVGRLVEGKGKEKFKSSEMLESGGVYKITAKGAKAYTRNEADKILKGVDTARAFFWDKKVHGDDVLSVLSKLEAKGDQYLWKKHTSHQAMDRGAISGSKAAIAISYGLSPISGKAIQQRLTKVITDGSNGVAQAFTNSAKSFDTPESPIETGGLSSMFNTKDKAGEINAFYLTEDEFLEVGFTKTDLKPILEKKINIINEIDKEKYIKVTVDEDGIVIPTGYGQDDDVMGSSNQVLDPEMVKTRLYLSEAYHSDVHNDEILAEDSHLTTSLLGIHDQDPYHPTRRNEYIPAGEEAMAIKDLPSGMRAVEIVKENYRQNLRKHDLLNPKAIMGKDKFGGKYIKKGASGVIIIDDTPLHTYKSTYRGVDKDWDETTEKGRNKIAGASGLRYRRNKTLLEEVIDEERIQPNVLVITAQDLDFVVDGNLDESLLQKQAMKIRDWIDENNITGLFVGGSIEKHSPNTMHRSKMLADSIFSDDDILASKVGWVRDPSQEGLPDEFIYGRHHITESRDGKPQVKRDADQHNRIKGRGALIDRATVHDDSGNERYLDEYFFNDVQGWNTAENMDPNKELKVQKTPTWAPRIKTNTAYWSGSGKASDSTGLSLADQVDQRGNARVDDLENMNSRSVSKRKGTRTNASIISGEYEKWVMIRDRALKRTSEIPNGRNRTDAVIEEIIKQLEELEPQKSPYHEIKRYHINQTLNRLESLEARLAMAKEQEAGGGTPVSDQLGRSLVEGEDRVTLEEEIDYYKSKLNEFETMDITGDLENPIKDYKAIAEKIIESKNNQYVIQLPKSKYYYVAADQVDFKPLEINEKPVLDTNNNPVYEHNTPEVKAKIYTNLWEEHLTRDDNIIDLYDAMLWIQQNGHKALVGKYMASNPMKGNAGIDPGKAIGNVISRIIGNKDHEQHALYREIMHDDYLNFFDRMVVEDLPGEVPIEVSTVKVDVDSVDGAEGRSYQISPLTEIMKGVRNITSDKIGRLRKVDELVTNQLQKVPDLEDRPVAFANYISELESLLYHSRNNIFTDRGVQDGTVEAWALRTLANIGSIDSLMAVDNAYFTRKGLLIGGGEDPNINKPFGKLYNLTDTNLNLDPNDPMYVPPFVYKGEGKKTSWDLNLVKKFMEEYTGDKDTELYRKLRDNIVQVERNIQKEFRPDLKLYPDLNKHTLGSLIAQGTKPAKHLDQANVLNKMILEGTGNVTEEYAVNNFTHLINNIINPGIESGLKVASYKYLVEALKRSGGRTAPKTIAGKENTLLGKLSRIAEVDESGHSAAYRDEWLEIDRSVDNLLFDSKMSYEETATNPVMVFRIADSHPNEKIRAVARNALIDAVQRGAAQESLGIGEQNDVIQVLTEISKQYRQGRKVFPDIPRTTLVYGEGAIAKNYPYDSHEFTEEAGGFNYYKEITNDTLQNDPVLEARAELIDTILDPDTAQEDLPLEVARTAWKNDPRFKLRSLAQSLINEAQNSIDVGDLSDVTKTDITQVNHEELSEATLNGGGDGPVADAELNLISQPEFNVDNAYKVMTDPDHIQRGKELFKRQAEEIVQEIDSANKAPAEQVIDTVVKNTQGQKTEELITEFERPAEPESLDQETILNQANNEMEQNMNVQDRLGFEERFEQELEALQETDVTTLAEMDDEFREVLYSRSRSLSVIKEQADEARFRLAMRQAHADDNIVTNSENPTNDTPTDIYEDELDSESDLTELEAHLAKEVEEVGELKGSEITEIQARLAKEVAELEESEITEIQARLAKEVAELKGGESPKDIISSLTAQVPRSQALVVRPPKAKTSQAAVVEHLLPPKATAQIQDVRVKRVPGQDAVGQNELSDMLYRTNSNGAGGGGGGPTGNGIPPNNGAAEDKFYWDKLAKDVSRDSIVDKNGVVWSAPNVGGYTEGKWLSKNGEQLYLPSDVRVGLQRAIDTLESPKEHSKYQRLKDTIYAQWKLNTLFPFPAFYMRNLLESAVWKGYIAGVTDPLAYQIGKDLAHFSKATGQAKERLRKKIGTTLNEQGVSYTPDQFISLARKHKVITPSRSGDMLDITSSKLMGEEGGPASMSQWVAKEHPSLGKIMRDKIANDLSSKTKRVGTSAYGSVLREYAESAQSGATKLLGGERATKVVGAATKVGEGLNVATKLLTSPVRKPLQYARDFGLQMNDLIEDTVRLALVYDKVGLEGLSFKSAAQFAEMVHFDYDKAEPIVQTLAKKAVPFIKWTRFNLPFMAKMKYGGEHQKFIPLFNAYEAMWKANPFQIQDFNGDLVPQFMVDQNVVPVGENKDGDVHFILPGSILAQDGLLRMMRRPQDIRHTALNMLYPWHQLSYEFWKNIDTRKNRELVNYPGQTAPWLGMRIDKRLEHALRKTVRLGTWMEKVNPAIVPKLEDGKLKFKNIFGKVMYRKADLNVPRNYRTYEPGYVPWGTDSPAQKQYDKEGKLRTLDIVNHVGGMPLQVFRFDPERAEKSAYWKSQSHLAELSKEGFGSAGWYNNVTSDIDGYDDTFKLPKKEYQLKKKLAQTNDTLNYLYWLGDQAWGITPTYNIPAQGEPFKVVYENTDINPYQKDLLSELGAGSPEALDRIGIKSKAIKHPYEKGKTVRGGLGYLEAKKTGLETQLEALSNAQNITSE